MKKILIIALALFAVGCTRGKGTYEGKLIDVSIDGWIWKSCEVDVQYGEGGSNVARYSTPDLTICEEMMKASGNRVKFTYHQTFGKCFSCESSDLIQPKIEFK